MERIADHIWVGSQADFEIIDGPYGTEWAIVHAAREPWHRALLGYKTRGAPKDHPEYLFARRDKRLYLNLIDTDNPEFVRRDLMDEAMRFIREHRERLLTTLPHSESILICCNQGGSRAPTVGLLWMAPELPHEFEAAEVEYRRLYPNYHPSHGLREFARANWSYYHDCGWAEDRLMDEPESLTMDRSSALDKAEQIWQRFCQQLMSDPALARDQLIKSLVQALSAAEPQDGLNHGNSPDAESSG